MILTIYYFTDDFAMAGGEECYYGGTTKNVVIDGIPIKNAVE